MKSDKQFYTLLGTDRDTLAALTGIEITGAYHFEAIEVKAIERRSDGCLLPDDPEEPIWIIEVQGYEDDDIYHRLLVEMGLIGEHHAEREIRGMLLFILPEHDPQTAPWHTLATTIDDPPIRVAYLPEVLEKLEIKQPDHPLLSVFLPFRIEDQSQLRAEAPAAYRRLQKSLPDEQQHHPYLDVFISWFMLRFNQLSYAEVLEMFAIRTPLEETRAYKELVAIGEARGEARGKAIGEAQLVIRQLKRRLGSLTPELEAQVRVLPIDQLEALGEALLDFESEAELKAWFASISS